MGFDTGTFQSTQSSSQPHGGGGPGSGPIGVKSHLAEFLPTPIVKEATIRQVRSNLLSMICGIHGTSRNTRLVKCNNGMVMQVIIQLLRHM